MSDDARRLSNLNLVIENVDIQVDVRAPGGAGTSGASKGIEQHIVEEITDITFPDNTKLKCDQSKLPSSNENAPLSKYQSDNVNEGHKIDEDLPSQRKDSHIVDEGHYQNEDLPSQRKDSHIVDEGHYIKEDMPALWKDSYIVSESHYQDEDSPALWTDSHNVKVSHYEDLPSQRKDSQNVILEHNENEDLPSLMSDSHACNIIEGHHEHEDLTSQRKDSPNFIHKTFSVHEGLLSQEDSAEFKSKSWVSSVPIPGVALSENEDDDETLPQYETIDPSSRVNSHNDHAIVLQDDQVGDIDELCGTYGIPSTYSDTHLEMESDLLEIQIHNTQASTIESLWRILAVYHLRNVLPLSKIHQYHLEIMI